MTHSLSVIDCYRDKLNLCRCVNPMSLLQSIVLRLKMFININITTHILINISSTFKRQG